VPFGDVDGDIIGIPGAQPRPLHRGRHVWVFANPCRRAHLGRCTGRLELVRPGAHTAFAHATFTRRGDIHVHLGPTAARRLGHTNSVAIRIRAKQDKRFGAQPSVAFVLAFRR